MHLINILQQSNSALYKKAIIKEHATEADKLVFQYAYDPSKTYGVKFDYINTNLLGNASDTMFHILDRLAARDLSGNEAREVVLKFAVENGDLIKLICNKDLDCGVSATTLNNIFGNGFIPKFAIQLAKAAELDKLEFPLWAQLKYNGARVVATYHNGFVTLKSRGGHSFTFLALQNLLMSMLAGSKSCVLDGELCIGDSAHSDHTDVSGLVNSSIKTGKSITATNLRFNVFDLLPLEEFNKQKCSLTYKNRFNALHLAMTNEGNKLISVCIARTETVNSLEELNFLYDCTLCDGFEGLILKSPNSLYTYKKNKTWLKMKAEETADLVCVGIVEGKGKYEGMIGALECLGTVDGKCVKVNVGSGLTDADRAANFNNYIGKCIEVKYNTTIVDNTTGNWSLFLPRFMCIRHDKS